MSVLPGGMFQFLKLECTIRWVILLFLVRIPDGISDAEAAPILCAGVTSYKAIRMAELKEGMSVVSFYPCTMYVQGTKYVSICSAGAWCSLCCVFISFLVPLQATV